MKMRTTNVCSTRCCSAPLIACWPHPALAQDKLTAVHAFPANWVYSKSFLEFVKKANEAGKGTFEITVRGGPEAMGMFEQPNAVRDGVVDMVYTPCAFYAAAVPECDAVSRRVDRRPDGAQERRLRRAQAGAPAAHGRVSTSAGSTAASASICGRASRPSSMRRAIWTSRASRCAATRSTTPSSPTTSARRCSTCRRPDLYTALERGTVDMTGWTEIGLMDANWDKFLKYRVDPKFFSTDLGVIINVNKWNSLSQKSRDILQRVAIEHEAVQRQGAERRCAPQEFAELDKRGMKVVCTVAGGQQEVRRRRTRGVVCAHEGAHGQDRRRAAVRVDGQAVRAREAEGDWQSDRNGSAVFAGRRLIRSQLGDEARSPAPTTALIHGMAWLAGALMALMFLAIVVDVLLRNLGLPELGASVHASPNTRC